MLTRGKKRNLDKISSPESVKTEDIVSIETDKNKLFGSSGENKVIASTSSNGNNNSSGRASRYRKNPEQIWVEKLKALKEFKVKNGHTNVPKNEKYMQLGRFVNNHRQFYRKKLEGETNSLTDDRVKALEELGFVWAMKPISENRARHLQSMWEARIQELQEYKNQHGHCNVPRKEGNGDLGKFVMNQRYYYKTRHEHKNSLTPERIQDLENLGFVWTLKGRTQGYLTNDEKWERNVNELKKFKEKFGHVSVTKSGEYTELGQFVGNQRYFYRRRLKGESTSLTDDRIKVLSDLGFGWRAPNKGGEGDDPKAHVSSKMKGSSQVVEKDREITLPDGSTINCTTKESSQKRLVILEDGSHALETTTKIYTTKVQKIVIPSEDVEEDVDLNIETNSTALPGDLNVLRSHNRATYPDGSSVLCTSEESSNKRLYVLEDETHLLEITTTTTATRVERSVLPGESDEPSVLQSDAELLTDGLRLSGT